ncbi:hypothetical protein ACIQI8_22350 [Streptomyces sp. NPDC092369]|uniref:hypothetical protein n=1 Tax=Streptomyces sp. NPDC092369 TaxID=3366015 RepID=UPI00382C105B
MAGGSSGFVLGLTTAALASVGFLAYQASASAPGDLSAPHRTGEPSATASKAPRDKRNPVALPSGSGKGERVVYSIDDDRVWLVGARDKVRRTFKVTPGTVDPSPGSYAVTSRSNAITGTDGTPIEHVVRFASADGVAIGFSAAVENAPSPTPGAYVRTGGIRESRADGDAMWQFATIGEPVVVIR